MLLKYSKGQLAKKFTKYIANDSKLRKVVAAVKKDFDKSGLTAHNWEHIWRDALNAIIIGEAEKADMGIVLPAIVMHDIGFLYGAIGKTHGAIGAKKLSMFLRKNKISYDKESVAHMADCIRTHKGSMHNEKPETLEAKVVADADLLEKFGYFGIYQYIRTFTEFNYPLEKIIKRNEGMKTLRMETRTGKKLAEPGRKLIIDFFNELDKAQNSYRE
jgi:HD superfamily phosphodiesterase